MRNIKKILLPVDIPIASVGVIYEAATLAQSSPSAQAICAGEMPGARRTAFRSRTRYGA